MKKGVQKYIIVWAILLVVFNVICFASPKELAGYEKFGGAFWAGYVFITLAFVGQLISARCAFKASNLKKLFYNIPLITISYTGLILMLVFGGLAMIIPDLPNWIGIIICLLVLAFTSVSVVKASAAAEIITGVDEKVKAQTRFVKALTVDAESLLARAATPEAKEACKKVFEAVRYSDPMSNDALAGVESQITLKFNEFSNAVTGGAENVTALADELVVLIGDRNKKCKLVK